MLANRGVFKSIKFGLMNIAVHQMEEPKDVFGAEDEIVLKARANYSVFMTTKTRVLDLIRHGQSR